MAGAGRSSLLFRSRPIPIKLDVGRGAWPAAPSGAAESSRAILTSHCIEAESSSLRRGGIAWESLELEAGRGTVVGQIEAIAANALKQILVQQKLKSSSPLE